MQAEAVVPPGGQALAPLMPRQAQCRPSSQLATLRRSNEMVAQALQTLTTAVEQQRALFDAWEGNV